MDTASQNVPSTTAVTTKETIPLIEKSRKSRLWLSCWCWAWRKWCASKELKPRTIYIGRPSTEKFPPNEIRNQKYNFFTFLPLVLFEQFRFFLNLYFLIMAVSQFIPDIRIGYLYTYWGPLGFVLAVTISREAIDDLRRHQRDREVNSQKYKRFVSADKPPELVSSSKLKVGDLIMVEKDERVPADLILLRTSDKSGAVFVRTERKRPLVDRLMKKKCSKELRNLTESTIDKLKETGYAQMFTLNTNLRIRTSCRLDFDKRANCISSVKQSAGSSKTTTTEKLPEVLSAESHATVPSATSV